MAPRRSRPGDVPLGKPQSWALSSPFPVDRCSGILEFVKKKWKEILFLREEERGELTTDEKRRER